MPDGKVHNYIFKGNPDEYFADESSRWGMMQPTCSNGAAYADFE